MVVPLLLVLLVVGGVHGGDLCVKCLCNGTKVNCRRLHISETKQIELDENIKLLDLSENDLIQLNDYAFTIASQMNELIITDNKISDINVLAFKGLSLSKLDLSRNKLNTISSEVFKFMKTVTELYLSDNEITNIIFTQIQQQTCSLTTLDLSRNNISRIEGSHLDRCNNLTLLNLAGNNIKEFEPFKLLSLRTINLSQTGITDINLVNFNNTPNLVSLYLSGNNITTLSKNMFTALHRLQQVNLSRNGLTNLESKVFLKCFSLWNVDLSHNKISSFDVEAFIVSVEDGPKNHNRASSHPECRKYPSTNSTSNISHLDLSFNNLDTLDPMTFSPFVNMSYLNMAHNLVRSFGPDWVCLMANATVVLKDNPLDCACDQMHETYVISYKLGWNQHIVCNGSDWKILENCVSTSKASDMVGITQSNPNQQQFYIILSAYVLMMLITIAVVVVISCILGEPHIDERWWEEKITDGEFL